jgi:hypothetical protein
MGGLIEKASGDGIVSGPEEPVVEQARIQVQHVLQRRSEAIREGGHVDHAGRFRRAQHLRGACGIERERLLAQDVFAARDGFERNLVVQVIRSGVHHSRNVIARQQIAIAGGNPRRADGCGGLRIRVAYGCDPHFRTQPESGDKCRARLRQRR